MKHLITTTLCLLCAIVAWSGHIMIEGIYTSPDDGVSIYPGTTRTYQVFVPDQYDGTTQACLYVGLDGVLCNAPAVIDSLIAVGKMPVTIGIFLQPGIISDARGEVIRYNRSNEFDTPDGTFARFLDEQLLPHALAQVTPDGRCLRVTPHGGDHMIFGLSSGGIAAFTAAWHRPDLFGRVFSGVGTFVAMRGGNDLQAIVRKHEPLPLRVFLQDGSNDAWNPLFGHWYEGNRMLATALDFAGYDCRFDWSDGGHNVRRSTEIFAQVMEWMWHDWPAPIAIGTTHNDFLAPLLIAGERWQQRPPQHVEPRPVMAVTPDSSLVAMRGAKLSNRLYQAVIGNDGRSATSLQPFYWLHAYDNDLLAVYAMEFDGDGNLWVLTSAGLQVCDQNGRVRAIIKTPQIDAESDAILQQVQITIGDGYVNLCDRHATYTRRFNVKAPISSQRPESQGQG